LAAPNDPGAIDLLQRLRGRHSCDELLGRQ
jgi:hypothetical protein